MTRELVIQTNSDSAEIALLRDGRLMELHHEHFGGEFQVGDMYLGKVKKLLPNLNACFVDIGYPKDAFLHYHDLGPNIPTFKKFVESIKHHQVHTHLLSAFNFEEEINKNGQIGDILKSNDRIVVQIVKEPISTKGPRLTSQISIAGRYLILLPFADNVSVSKKIDDKDERKRLKELISSIKPKGFGVIVRTISNGLSVTELDQDLRELIQKWKETYLNLKANKKRIYSEQARAELLLRDMLNDSFQEIKVDNPAIQKQLQEFLKGIAPNKVDIVKIIEPKTHNTIFGELGINRQKQSLFGKIVNMGGGAYLIIEHTEAMHVVDVNSGSKRVKDENQEDNALKTNLDAADEIARQLRLRDMGGIIVVDFIDMRVAANRKTLVDRMRDAMNEDRAKHTILPLSKFGLMQITRQRVRPEVQIGEKNTCPLCKGTGNAPPAMLVAEEIERKIKDLVKENKLTNNFVQLEVHPYLEAFLTKGFFSKRINWLIHYKKWVRIKGNNDLALTHFEFTDVAKTPN